ncbi:MAG: Crp/Fnr family transcriptional regulator [Pseudomonadota bacterium]
MTLLTVKELTLAAHIEASPMFRHMPPDAQERLVAMASMRQLPDRARLHAKGDAPEGVYAVHKGIVRASASTADGREGLLALMEPGCWFGESSMLGNTPRTYDADAQGDSEVVLIPRAGLQGLLDARPELYQHIVPFLCQRIRLSMQLLESHALLPFEGQLARRLLILSRNAIQGDENQARVTLSLSQESLGRMLGSSRQSINKTLKMWEANGLIRQTYGSITLCDLALLESLASPG